MSSAPVGVFDSGIGGLSVLKALRAELPQEQFIYFADTAHAPYGERGDGHVIARTRAIVQQLRDEHAIKALVVACNTATAAAIHIVRAEHPDLPMVGVEPALKPAAASTRTGRVGVLATRGTLSSAKLRALHDSLRGQCEFVLQPCDGLADAIESRDAAQVAALGKRYLAALGPLGTQPREIDTIVLGCTHYPFAWDVLSALAGPQVTLLETGAPVARQARRLLEAGAALAHREGGATLLSSGARGRLDAAAADYLV